MLTLKKSTLNQIRRHCSHKLIEKVFLDYGNDKITIDETNRIADIWEVTDYLNEGTLPFEEKCKVILSFDRAFGKLIYIMENHTLLRLFVVCCLIITTYINN